MSAPEKFERLGEESWRDVVRRVAKQQGLCEECLEEFDFLDGNMADKKMAAQMALYEWDCFPPETAQ